MHAKLARCPPALVAVMVALAASFHAACGAGDKLSGAVDPQPARCPKIQEFAPNFYRLLNEGRFDGLRAVLEGELGRPLDARNPNGPTRLSALIGVLTEVIRAVDVPGMRGVLLDTLRATETGPLLSQVAGLLKYVDGKLGCPAGTTCERYDLIDVLRALLTSKSCTETPANFDARAVLDLLVRLLKHPRLPDLVDLLPRLLENPTFRSVLDGFRFDNCDRGPCEQEDGFAALIKILLDNVLVSPLPWATIRDLLRQVDLLTPEVASLLDIAQELLVERPTDPERDVLGPMRVAIRCLRIVDPRQLLSRNIYRLLSLDEVSLSGLLEGVDQLVEADPERRLIRVLTAAMEYFRARGLPAFQTLQLVLDVVLSPSQAKLLFPALIAMVEGGVLTEITNLLVALTDDCARVTGTP